MYRELLEKSPLLALPIFALFIFIAVFVMIVLRTYAKKSAAYAHTAALPLERDDVRLDAARAQPLDRGDDHV